MAQFELEQSLYNWNIICLSCLNSPQIYTRKEDSKCYLCSDLIIGCLNCSYGNSTVLDLSSNYPGNLLFLSDVSAYTSSYTTQCYKCSANQIPQIINFITTCVTCSSQISNCNTCDYGYLNSSGDLIFPDDYYNENCLNLSTYQIRCLDCEDLYGLTDSNQTTCGQCPSNCESCYYNSSISGMFCGQCQDYYVLSIYEGLCYINTSYTDIMKTYSGSCLKMVSNNPWVANISGNASNYLCQKCLNPSLYPSISGYCVPCANSTCSSCIEASDFLNLSDTINYTNLVISSH